MLLPGDGDGGRVVVKPRSGARRRPSTSPTRRCARGRVGQSSPASQGGGRALWWGAGGAARCRPGASRCTSWRAPTSSRRPPGRTRGACWPRSASDRRRTSRWSATPTGSARWPTTTAWRWCGPVRCRPSSSTRHPAGGHRGQRPRPSRDRSGPPMTRSPSRSTGGSRSRCAEPAPAPAAGGRLRPMTDRQRRTGGSSFCFGSGLGAGRAECALGHEKSTKTSRMQILRRNPGI